MAFKSSHHLQLCQLPKLDTGGASAVGPGYKWPSSLLKMCSSVGYPSWTLEECQLGVMITNGLQVFLPFAAVLVTQAGHWGSVSLGLRLQNGLQVFLPRAVMLVTQARC